MKKVAILLILLTMVSCDKVAITSSSAIIPDDLRGDWYFVGVLSHLADSYPNPDNVNLAMTPKISITPQSITGYTFGETIAMQVGYGLPLTDRPGIAISADTRVLGFKATPSSPLGSLLAGKLTTEQKLVGGLQTMSSYYLDRTGKQWYLLTINSSYLKTDYLAFARKQ